MFKGKWDVWIWTVALGIIFGVCVWGCFFESTQVVCCVGAAFSVVVFVIIQIIAQDGNYDA